MAEAKHALHTCILKADTLVLLLELWKRERKLHHGLFSSDSILKVIFISIGYSVVVSMHLIRAP